MVVYFNNERGRKMKKKISVLALSSILIAGSALASGYRIPEQSIDSTAKAGANVSSATSADMSYYNPANMSWAKDTYMVEMDVSYIRLPAVSYTDNRSTMMNGSSKEENFLIPTFFLVSPDYNNFRFGLSFVAPFGLSKRWDQVFPRSTAEEYSLTLLEMSPSVSYKINDMFSVAGGIRFLHSSAKVSSHAAVPGTGTLTREMDGDTNEFGYNLAVSAKPTDDMNISVSYRSNVDLDLEGDVSLATTMGGPFSMETEGDVSIPAPAVLSVSFAYTFGPATIDVTWDRTFWSEYEAIEFNYDTPIMHPVLNTFFTPAVPKNWDDSNAYRIGLDYRLDNGMTIMAGFAYDETPVPTETLGFELPDSDAWLYSLGFKYHLTEQVELGFAYLYDYKESRKVVNGSPTQGINGEFSNSRAHLMSVGLKYDF